MALDKLRAKALAHIADRQVMHTVSLNDEVTLKLSMLRNAIERTTMEAAQQRQLGEAAPARRTLADTTSAAEHAVEQLELQVASIIEQAKADDELVNVRFGVAPDGRDNPAGYFERVAAKYDDLDGGRGAHAAQLKRELVAASYIAAESLDGESLELDWATVSAKLLSHTDLEQLDAAVLDLYRSVTTIPFDPASYLRQPLS